MCDVRVWKAGEGRTGQGVSVDPRGAGPVRNPAGRGSTKGVVAVRRGRGRCRQRRKYHLRHWCPDGGWGGEATVDVIPLLPEGGDCGVRRDDPGRSQSHPVFSLWNRPVQISLSVRGWGPGQGDGPSRHSRGGLVSLTWYPGERP